ncbi:hypothetical protein RQP46_006902 [Phenoliferia psychrophenolica]
MGIFLSKNFDATRDIPNLSGRVALVTGATAGLGYQTAKFLALTGAKVYVGSRSEAKGVAAIKLMEDECPTLRGEGRLHVAIFDLDSLVGTKKAALAFLESEERLDILVNNAGRGGSFHNIGPEGIEQAFVGNVLGPFVLTTTLLPLLKKTASLPGSDVRIVNIASAAHTMVKVEPKFASLEDFNSLCVANPKDANTFLNRTRRYGMSKLANILFAKELQRRLLADPTDPGSSIISLSLHPGLVATRGVLSIFSWISWTARLWSLTPVEGAASPLFAATSPRVREKAEQYQAAYLGPFGEVWDPSNYAKDEELAKTFWSTSERVVGDVLQRAGM